MNLYVFMGKKNERWESAKILFEEDRRLCSQLFEISCLLFNNCLLSFAAIAVRSRLHILQILLAPLMFLLVCGKSDAPFRFWFDPHLPKYYQTKSDNLELCFYLQKWPCNQKCICTKVFSCKSDPSSKSFLSCISDTYLFEQWQSNLTHK